MERELWKSVEAPLKIQLSMEELFHVGRLAEAGEDPLGSIRRKSLGAHTGPGTVPVLNSHSG